MRRVHFSGDRLAGDYRRGDFQDWVATIYWRLGHHGPGTVIASSEEALVAKLKRLDPTVQRGARLFDPEE